MTDQEATRGEDQGSEIKDMGGVDTPTKILLLDDEDVVRDELGGLLEEEGYAVITGKDGEEGMRLFREHQPDMIITDVRMPHRDGLDVTRAVRREKPGIPIVVITGHGSESMAIQALRLGVVDFIKKPVKFEELVAALGRMEGHRRVRGPRTPDFPKSVKLLESNWVYTMANDLDAVPDFVDLLLDQCAGDLDRAPVLELSLALRELIINAVEHGNLGLNYDDKTRALESGDLDGMLTRRAEMAEYRDRKVTVLIQRRERQLVIHIQDEGMGFDWRSLPDPTDPLNLLSIHGRGILLARLSSDELEFNGTGNGVVVTKNC